MITILLLFGLVIFGILLVLVAEKLDSYRNNDSTLNNEL